MSQSPEDLLRRAGARPGFKFPTLGTECGGRVESVDTQQQSEFGTRLPVFDGAGNPVMELVVCCVAADGERAAFYASGQMLAAIKEAVLKETQGYNIAPGGELYGTWATSKPSTTKGYADQKIYTFRYSAPKHSGVNVGDLA